MPNTKPKANTSEPSAEIAATFLIDQLRQRAQRSAAGLTRLAGALHTAGEQLEGNAAGAYLEAASAQLEKLTRLLQADPDDIVAELKTFARAQPALFLGGALLAGFGSARFFKSSERLTGPAPRATRRSPTTPDSTHGDTHDQA